MKKRVLILYLLFGWLCGMQAATNIPEQSTVYLDVSGGWGCKASYVIYCSGWNPQGYQVFSPVAGVPGVYQCVLTKSVNSKVHFGASDQVITEDGTGWIGGFCGSYIYETATTGWSTSTPCWVIDNITGAGHWGEVPTTSSSYDAVIDSITFTMVSSCVTKTYNVTVNAYFKGEACSYKLTGSQFTRDIVRSNPVSPVTYTLKNLPATDIPVQETITFALCSDGSGNAEIVSQTVEYNSPTLDCEVVHETLEVCAGMPDVVLEASMEGDSYLWSTGETTKSITVPSTATETYSVEVFSITRSAQDNLMANGDFEEVVSDGTPPPGFTSSYNYVGTFDPSQYYSSHGGASNLFAITHNANYFWRDFADIEPHGGNYYALFDAGKSGYAWKATTSDNTSLSVEEDSVYIFSYWAAYPNIRADASPAWLQFRITYTNEQGVDVTENLGQLYELGQEADLNAWYYQEVQWKAPCNSATVTISVEDLNSASSGNDFCLDDILFQRTTSGQLVLAKKDIYPVKSLQCDVIEDTICLGERYTQYGFDVQPTEPGLNVYTDPESQSTLSLFVVEPLQVTITEPGILCNFGEGVIELPFSVQQGTPIAYSLSCANPLVVSVEEEPLSGYSMPVTVTDSIFEPTEIRIAIFNEYGHCDPFTKNITLDFRRCDYMTDTVCTGEPYDKDGFHHPADHAGTYKLEKGNDTLLLTVIESIEMIIPQPAPLCNVQVDTLLTIPYTVVSGSPGTYSLHFSTPLIPAVENAPLQGNQFTILVPAGVEETVQVTFYTEEATGHCSFETQFAIGRNAGAAIYRKWDDILFVDNGNGDYVSYQWFCDGVAIEGATQQDYYTGASLNDGHVYYVVVTRADGSTLTSCPVRFDETPPSSPLNPGEDARVPYQVRHYYVGPHVDIIQTVFEDGSIDVQKQIKL